MNIATSRSASGVADAPEGATLATRLSAQLRSAIMSGSLRPGARLVLDRLRKEFGTSLSPLREALCRLEREGLVRAEDQRGYRVSPVSTDNLDEVVRLRVELETMAAREAMRHGDEAWEERVLTALRRLQRCAPGPRDAAEQETWETRHRAFHAELISACRMPVLRQFCATLHDQSDRYRRIFLSGHQPDRDVPAEHEAIATAMVERREEDAAAALRAHIERTGRNIRAILPSNGQDTGP